MAVVAADPNAVDKPLIERVNGDDILSARKLDLNFVIVIMERITRRRPLANESAVEPQLVVIVSRNVKSGAPAIRIKFLAELFLK